MGNPLPFLTPSIQPTEEFHLDWDRFLQDASEDVHALFQQAKDDILAQPEPDNDDAKEFRDLLMNQDDLRPQVFELDVQPISAASGDDNYTPPSPSPTPDPDGTFPWDNLVAPGK